MNRKTTLLTRALKIHLPYYLSRRRLTTMAENPGGI